MSERVFWQPETGKLPVLIGDLLPENGTEDVGLRRVKRWGAVEQVGAELLRPNPVAGATLIWPRWEVNAGTWELPA